MVGTALAFDNFKSHSTSKVEVNRKIGIYVKNVTFSKQNW